jgi:hypothetical protein
MKTKLKGVYTLNPTQAVMKSGSTKARRAVTEDVPGFKQVKRPRVTKAIKPKGKTK